MNKTLAASLLLLATSAFAAAPMESALALAAQLGVPVPPRPLPHLEAPPSSDAPRSGGAQAASVSVPISGNITVAGSGFMGCSGGPRGPGSMSGWINLRADVEVRTRDGASGVFPVTGDVFLSGSCQNGGGFVSGSAMVSGWGTVYKMGRPVGTASLSGNAFVNQYVSGGFASVRQSVFVSGQYDSNDLTDRSLRLSEVRSR